MVGWLAPQAVFGPSKASILALPPYEYQQLSWTIIEKFNQPVSRVSNYLVRAIPGPTSRLCIMATYGHCDLQEPFLGIATSSFNNSYLALKIQDWLEIACLSGYALERTGWLLDHNALYKWQFDGTKSKNKKKHAVQQVKHVSQLILGSSPWFGKGRKEGTCVSDIWWENYIHDTNACLILIG